MKFLKILFYIAIFLLISYAIASLCLKKTFSIERKIVIHKPDSVVYRFFIDLNQFKTWNVWTGNVKDIKKEVSGSGKAPGDIYTWEGDKIGEGELKNLQALPHLFLKQELTFKRPIKQSQFSDMYFKPLVNNTQTEVIWRYYGENESTMDRIFLFLYASVLKKDLDQGLLNAKQMIENK